MKPQRLLEMFGVEQRARGALLFLKTCYLTALTGCTPYRTVQLIREREGLTSPEVIRAMAAALRPVLDMTEEERRALELPLENRGVLELIRALSDELRCGVSTETTYRAIQNLRDSVIVDAEKPAVYSFGKSTRSAPQAGQGPRPMRADECPLEDDLPEVTP